MFEPTCFAQSCAILLLAALQLGIPNSAVSQESALAASASTHWLNRIRGQVRHGTASLAQELDEFFSDREYVSEQNETRLVLRFHIDHSSVDPLRFRVDPQLRLRLPNAQRLIFLDILGTGPRRNDEPGSGGGIVDPTKAEENSGVIQLRGSIEALGVRISPVLGVDVDAGNPRAFAGIRASAYGDLAPGVGVYGSQRVIAYSDGGREAITLLRGDVQTSETSVLRGQFVIDWNADREGLRYEPAIIYRWVASEKTVLSFESYFRINSAPGGTADYFFTGLRLRRRVYEDWLYGELRPWLSFEKGDYSSRVSGAELMIEVNF